MVHSEVYLNKYMVSIAPFSTPAFTPLHPNSENCFFANFRFLIFIHISSGGQLTPFAPMCYHAEFRPFLHPSDIARVQIAAATQSRNSLRQTVHTHCASVHQAAKLAAES